MMNAFSKQVPAAMNVASVKQFCRSFAGVTEKISGHPANILTYSVADKKFAYFKTSEPEQWRFSFRATPQRFLELTDQPGIRPARYMHRFHWVTVVKVASMDEAYLRELIQWSYDTALSALPKKVQREIRGGDS
jgi:predicted DNA-binding protein (MmcQ/YjbR family)|tara:strand:- start:2024 stop:2425 length:402 start_codon:yes stop_codon:yes gene_type:complete